MKKTVKLVILVLVTVAVAFGAVILLKKDSSAPAMTDQDTSSDIKTSAEKAGEPSAQMPTLSQGRYINYSYENVADQGYSQTIIFFYAPWCPECRAFKKAIIENSIPDGVQILETDFDSSTDLKKKYCVTQQTTFVRVNSAGELQKKWPGYGKEKSIDLVLEGVK